MSNFTPAWFKKGFFNESLFCDDFLSTHQLLYSNGAFFTPDGRMTDTMPLRCEIFEMMREYVGANLAKKVTNVVDVLKLAAQVEDFPPVTDRIALANGTLYLDGTFQEGKPEIVRNRLPVKYDPKAPQPTHWLRFLSDLLYPEDIPTVQEFIGYCLIPSNKGQRMMVIKGSGGEGKSQIGVVLSRLFGCNMKDGSIGKISENRFARADLEHTLLCVDDDMRMEALRQTNYVKSIVTAQGQMDLERKGKQSYQGWMYVRLLPGTCPEETNVYDMRLTQHEDGWIYGVFCSESKDTTVNDLSAAVAAAGIVRTKDLKTWERLPNLVTKRSPQQRNVDLLPEFVNGKYAFYTRPMDDFIDTGSGGGVGFGLCDDITHAVIDEEIITSPRRYHTITEAKNGEGATPIKTEKGWLHIAHGVRNTAAGLRYVIYVFVTALDDPAKVIAEPAGFLIAPRDWERVGDVSNVVFTNGAIADEDGSVYIYYASSDTRLHVASTTIEKLLDFAFNTPADPLRSVDCVKQRCELIDKNLEYLKSIGE